MFCCIRIAVINRFCSAVGDFFTVISWTLFKKMVKKKKTDILRLINNSSPTPQPLMLPQYPLCCSLVFYFQSRLVSTAIFNNLSLSLSHSVSDALCHKQKDKKNPNTHLHFTAAATSTTTTSLLVLNSNPKPNPPSLNAVSTSWFHDCFIHTTFAHYTWILSLEFTWLINQKV